MSSNNNILIIGAGVGGLVLAQGLQSRGIPFRVFERDASFSSKSQGYRFRLVHEGLEALERTLPRATWDLLEKTHAVDSPPDLMQLDSQTGEASMVLRAQGTTDRERSMSSLPTTTTATFASPLPMGLPQRAAWWSARTVCTRARFPDLKLLDVERTTIWGRTPLTPDFLRLFDRPDVLANHFAFTVDAKNPTHSCLFAPIRWPGDVASLSDGKLSPTSDYMFWALNFPTPESRETTATPEARAALTLELTKDWNPSWRALFEMQDESSLYAIKIMSSRPDLPRWETDPRLTFVGDAIHAMSPTGGSGGLTTVQDAADLCDALAAGGLGREQVAPADVLRDNLRVYEDKMRARAKAAIEYSFANAKFLWGGKEWSEYNEE
ncbi:hypothetical protein K438DRAFT_1783383 [Mycena galopus ATCC 62051]|nr:hypothetical protein K438DRAFT_1783383 [Mycena galopus ATCC 62051]